MKSGKQAKTSATIAKAAEKSPGPGSKPDQPTNPASKPTDDIDRLATMRIVLGRGFLCS